MTVTVGSSIAARTSVLARKACQAEVTTTTSSASSRRATSATLAAEIVPLVSSPLAVSAR